MDWSAIVRAALAIICVVTAECAKLNDYILDYQPLTYDKTTVHKHHERVRRSTDSQLKIRFKAYGRHFQLELFPAEGIFSPDHMMHTSDKGLHSVDTSFIYHGRIKGEPQSAVHVSVINGSIEGHVELPETRYHIEPAAKYMQNPAFHTIIYPETHLDKDPYRARRAAEHSGCAVDDLREWMEAASQVDPAANREYKRSVDSERERQPHNIYTESSNRQKRSPFSSSRQKRALGAQNTCPLHIRADPLLFNYFKDQKHAGGISGDQAEEEILAFFANHVNAISTIYSNTVFQKYDGTTRNTGLGFNIRRTTVMRNCDSPSVSNDYCTNTLDVSNYLDLTSREDHDDYCLTFTFTYRDFSGGTLGLAWVATEANTQSGVCGRYTTFTGGQKKSLNTGIVTIINFGKTVPNRVSQLTFAHEAGHNFGSPHDIGSDVCAPFGTGQSNSGDGNYIMFPSATSGDKPNNDDFSPCSRDNMTRIIQQVVDGQRFECFTESGAAFCGNKITEGTEECDCGFADECNAQTSCCEPRDPSIPDSGCALPAGKDCSPESGVCCDDVCNFIPLATDKECAAATDCSERTVCNGATFRCPDPVAKPNGTFCNEYSKVCVTGECIGPVCKNIAGGNWEECFLVSGDGVAESDFCYVACKNPNTGNCISSNKIADLNKAENTAFKDVLKDAASEKYNKAQADVQDSELPIQLPAGSACDNFRGYCDAFNMCERIDAQGPFNQLTDMIFDPVTLGKVKDWIVEHWWAVLLMAVGLVVFMGVFIKVFSYNTPSENPKHKRMREEREKSRAQQAARANAKQGRPPSQPPPSAPYHTSMDMDMAQYGRGSHSSHASNQYDRINPGYAGHSYGSPGYGGSNYGYKNNRI